MRIASRLIHRILCASLLVPAALAFSGCPTNQPPLAEFIGSPQLGSAPLVVQFQDYSLPGGQDIRKWEWDFGDGLMSGEQHPSHRFDTPGNYSVTLRVTTSAGESTELKQNYIHVSVAGVSSYRIACVNTGVHPVTAVYVVPVDAGSVGRNLLAGAIAPSDTQVILMDFPPNYYIVGAVFNVDGFLESTVLPGGINSLAMMAAGLTLELNSEGPGQNSIAWHWGWSD